MNKKYNKYLLYSSYSTAYDLDVMKSVSFLHKSDLFIPKFRFFHFQFSGFRFNGIMKFV